MFGGDWCGWCHKLHGLFATDPAIRKTLSNEYVLVMVDTKANGADTLFGRCKAALSEDEAQKAIGYPFLAVLDSDGKVVTAQRTDPLEEGDHHHPGRVNDFLTKWTVTPKDAEVVFRDGLARAISEDKRVFLTFSAPWCGWCHKLADWMAQPEVAAILDREFVTVRVDIDRMTHGKDVPRSSVPRERRHPLVRRSSTPKASRWATPMGPRATSATPSSPRRSTTSWRYHHGGRPH